MARRISAAVRAALAPHGVLAVQGDGAPVTTAAALFGGTVIIDANDLGQDILGHDTGRPGTELVAAFADNPLGQAREQTPFAVVVAQWPEAGQRPRIPRQRRSGPRTAQHQHGRMASWRPNRTSERGAA
jgi:asparagine synthase (glutamine-hydrolysing)